MTLQPHKSTIKTTSIDLTTSIAVRPQKELATKTGSVYWIGQGCEKDASHKVSFWTACLLDRKIGQNYTQSTRQG